MQLEKFERILKKNTIKNKRASKSPQNTLKKASKNPGASFPGG
jgi:hypothetical protein